MRPSLLRLFIFSAICFYNFSIAHCQDKELQDLTDQYSASVNLTQKEHLSNLLNAEKNYYSQDSFENYLKVKYSIFELLANDEKIEAAYQHANFKEDILTNLQQVASEELISYYDRILRYSIKNQHFEAMKYLAQHSLNGIQSNTRTDSIYMYTYYSRIGLTCRYLGEYETSFENLQNSLKVGTLIYGEDHLTIASTYYNIGVNYSIIGNYHEGLKYLLQAKDTKLKHYTEDSLALKSEFNALGMVYEGLGEYDLAMEYHEKTIHLKSKNTKQFNLGLGRSYLNLGTLLLSMGKPQLAYQKSKFALNQLKDIGKDDAEMNIWLLNNIGRSLIAMDRPEEARKYLNIGLLKNKNKFDLSIDASLEENLGMATMKMKFYDDAIKYLSSSQEKFIKDSPIHQRIAQLDIGLSKCYFHKENYKRSEAYALQSLGRVQNKIDKKHPLLFQPYFQLGKVYNKLKDERRAIEYINKIDSLSNIPSLQLLQTLNLKLEILEKLDRHKFIIEKNKGNKLIAQTLKKYIPTEEKYLLSKEIKKYYNLCLRNWEANRNPESELLSIFSNSKNSILKASVLSNQLATYADIPSKITDREYALAKKIRNLEKLIVYNYEPSSQDTSRLNMEILENTHRQYKSLLDTIEQYYPRYFDLKYNSNQSAMNNLATSLNENTAVLDYFIGKEYIWTLRLYKGKYNLYKKSIDDEWSETLLSYKNSLIDHTTILDESNTNSVYNNFVSQSPKIYTYLLAESLENLPDTVNYLVIIPDGILNLIPFETLLQSDKNIISKDYKNLDYLINSYSIGYAYSISLINNHIGKSENSKVNYSGFAPQYLTLEYNTDLTIPLTDLPSARESVVKSSQLFEGRSYVSDHATKVSFVNSADEASVLHLAMHCVIDNDSPMDTKLIFDSNSNDNANYLKASDLYNLQLDNQLSVLTACNTGVGNIREGEGVISLSRAFTYAGSESLMMSLWNVPDTQTADIVESFFANLKEGRRKDESLRNAKLDYLARTTKSTSHPMFWAGFIITGNTAPINLSAGSSPLFYIIPLIGFLLFLLYRVRQ